eukprot:6972725-Prorocentrum_lima.AAC.1
MTSSLVGSEMCIRDRSKLEGASTWMPDAWGVLVRRAAIRHLCVVHSCSTPVSYTHLTLPTICSV